jgi:hypothetical protein
MSSQHFLTALYQTMMNILQSVTQEIRWSKVIALWPTFGSAPISLTRAG